MPAQQLDVSKGRSAVSSLANNPSSQALISTSYTLGPLVKGSSGPVYLYPGSQESGLNAQPKREPDSSRSPNFVTKSQWITVAILTFVNLINYMDRYTIAGKKKITTLWVSINKQHLDNSR